MKIIWSIEDGYVGKDRPQYTEIPDEELDECETVEEKLELIYQAIQEDFDQNITWSIETDLSVLE